VKSPCKYFNSKKDIAIITIIPNATVSVSIFCICRVQYNYISKGLFFVFWQFVQGGLKGYYYCIFYNVRHNHSQLIFVKYKCRLNKLLRFVFRICLRLLHLRKLFCFQLSFLNITYFQLQMSVIIPEHRFQLICIYRLLNKKCLRLLLYLHKLIESKRVLL